jgi:hypothetical protein
MEVRTRLRVAALAAGLVALLAIVTLAARAGRGGLPGGGSIPGPSAGFYDFAFTFVLVVGGAIAVSLLVSTLRVHSFRPREIGPWHIVRSILPIVLLAGIGALAVRLHLGHRLHIPAAQSQIGQAGSRPTIGPIPGKPHTVGFRWEMAAVLAGLLLLGGAYVALRRRPELQRLPEVASLQEELLAAFDESLDDLRAERDPRRAVIAAYARAERILATHGAGRRPSETPMEYLASVLRRLRIRPDAVLELTALFQRAKFSRHAVDDAMKEDAISALAAVRDELRAVA